MGGMNFQMSESIQNEISRVVFKAREFAFTRAARLLAIAAIAGMATALPAAATVPTLTAGSTGQGVRLDGSLDEPAWQHAGVIANLSQQDPYPGEPTPFTTEVRVLVDEEAVYFGFVCHDPEPSRIAVHTMQRDGCHVQNAPLLPCDARRRDAS